jgi:Tol biopolymer transport system component
MDSNGSNKTNLTANTGVFDAFPEWSPDGTQFVYDSDRPALDDVWVMDADGTNETQLTANRRHEFGPTFSPNGMRIAFNREGSNGRIGVWTMGAGGTGQRQRTFGQFDFFADWHPN